MSIAFATDSSWSGGPYPVTVTITINPGDTAVLFGFLNPATLSISISGGGTWTQRGPDVTHPTAGKLQCWAINPGSGTSATQVVITVTGTITDVAFGIWVGTGVQAFGNIVTSATGSSINNTTQDANNWCVAGFGWPDGTITTAVTGNLRVQDPNTAAAIAILDNTVATPGTCTIAASHAGLDAAGLSLELRSVSGGGIVNLTGQNVGTISQGSIAPKLGINLGGQSVGTLAQGSISTGQGVSVNLTGQLIGTIAQEPFVVDATSKVTLLGLVAGNLAQGTINTSTTGSGSTVNLVGQSVGTISQGSIAPAIGVALGGQSIGNLNQGAVSADVGTSSVIINLVGQSIGTIYQGRFANIVPPVLTRKRYFLM